MDGRVLAHYGVTSPSLRFVAGGLGPHERLGGLSPLGPFAGDRREISPPPAAGRSFQQDPLLRAIHMGYELLEGPRRDPAEANADQIQAASTWIAETLPECALSPATDPDDTDSLATYNDPGFNSKRLGTTGSSRSSARAAWGSSTRPRTRSCAAP
jgi:hypothetical protein